MSSSLVPETRKLRLAIADDDQLVLDALSASLRASEGFDILCSARTGEDLLQKIRRHNVDVVLLDVEMPGQGGIETARTLHELRPEIRIVMYTAFARDDFLEASLRAGAQGFLTKDTPFDHVGRALRDAAAGRTVMDSRPVEMLTEFYLTHALAGHRDPDLEQQIARLPTGLRSVFDLMARGYSNKQIAAQLSITPGSAKTMASRVLQALGLESRSQLVFRAASLDLDAPSTRARSHHSNQRHPRHA